VVADLEQDLLRELRVMLAYSGISRGGENPDIGDFVDIADERPSNACVVSIATVETGTDQVGPMPRVVPPHELGRVVCLDIHSNDIEQR
jgi:hypothetical protein